MTVRVNYVLTYSASTVISNEIWSYYKIPFCGPCQATPQLSNKNLYPYFFRTQSPVVQSIPLLQSWGVTRVAIVRGSDEMSYQLTLSLKKLLFENDIILLSELIIPINIKPADYRYMYNSLKNVDARHEWFFKLFIVKLTFFNRYIFLFAQSDDTENFYFNARY